MSDLGSAIVEILRVCRNKGLAYDSRVEGDIMIDESIVFHWEDGCRYEVTVTRVGMPGDES
jgi:hypothetical protein